MTSPAVLVAQPRAISEVRQKLEPAAGTAWARVPIENNGFSRAAGDQHNQLADRFSIGGQ
jgi:hypothetical protein